MTADRRFAGPLVAVLLLVCLLAGAARAAVTVVGATARATDDQLWLVVTEQTEEKAGDKPAVKTLATSVRRLVDPVRGTWAESTRLPGRALAVAPMADRVAVLSDDGTWRLAWDGGQIAGPPPPAGHTLLALAADAANLWATAAGPADSLVLLKWTERDGWANVGPLPPDFDKSAAVGVVNGEPVVAVRLPGGVRIQTFKPAAANDASGGAWQSPVNLPVTPNTDGYQLDGLVTRAPRPIAVLAAAGRDTLLLDANGPRTVPGHFGGATLFGPYLKLVAPDGDHVKQIALDDFGRGRVLGPDKLANPARPQPDPAGWVSPLLLAILTLMTLRSLRPQPDDPMGVAPGLVAAPLARRVAAVVVDAGPCVAAGYWAFAAFTAAGPPTGSGPALLAGYLVLMAYLAHVTACEVAFGRSLGKWLFGLKVVSIDGTRAPPGRIMLRNLLRLLEIQLILPIAVVFITPTGQRLGDLAARTMVVSDDSKVVPKSAENDAV